MNKRAESQSIIPALSKISNIYTFVVFGLFNAPLQQLFLGCSVSCIEVLDIN